jgi:predicted dehydrogenase
LLRAGVIGCGAIAHEHLAHLARCDTVALVAVCDRSAASRAFAAERFGAAHQDADASLLLARDLDVVHICTPPASHPHLVAQALDAGAHVVCEKPLAPTAPEAAALLDHAGSLGLQLMESQNYRWNDPVRAIDGLVADGRLGAVRTVEVALALDLTAGVFGDGNLQGPGVDLPGGAVHDFLPHLSYLFLHFASHEGPVDGVAGWLTNASGNPRVGFDQLEAVVGAGAVRGHLRVASDLAPDSLRLAVRGTAGGAETDLYQPYLRVQDAAHSGVRAPLEQLGSGLRLAASSFTNAAGKVLGHGAYHGIPRMLDAFYQAVASHRPSPVEPAWIHSTALLTDRLVGLRAPSAEHLR